jgi:hypothetical protein
MDERRSIAGSAGLVAIAFLGTLVVLLGLVVGFRRLSAAATSSPTAPVPSVVATDAGGGTPSAHSSGRPSASESAAPFPSASGDPVLVGAGDIASCNLDGDEATARLLDGIAGTVFTAGDNAYDNGSASDFAECYEPTWGRHKARTRPAAGNHDWASTDAQGYRGYFGPSAVNTDGDTWYSYELGHWHIVVLDANCGRVGGCGPDSDQGRWLAADLADHPATCTLAVWHQPRFSSGDEHGNDPSVDPFWRALYAAGADVVVNGHDHDYERFAPQDPDGREDRRRGIRQFVVGTGGAVIRGFDEPVANSELRVATSPGVIEFTLHPRSYNWRWIPTTDTASDSGSAPCH